MFKILTYLLLSYFVYQYFIKPVLPKGEEKDIPNIKNKKNEKGKKNGLGEYIDYEDVD